MTHGSLFSGIGGFDLAAEWMGWENVFHCEWNTFGQQVLKYYWPKAISYEDITKTDFSIHRGSIDILTGGFPCQPYSMAGKRKGKEDDRHLWPEMLRAIREIQPRWVVGENVLGLVNWNGGMVFNEVQADLEAAGYEVWPYVLAAASVGAPHRRDQIWFVAYAENYGCKQRGEGVDKWQEYQLQDRDKIRNISTTNGEQSTTPHPNRNGFNGSDCEHEEQPSEGGEYAFGNANKGNVDGDAADTDSARWGQSDEEMEGGSSEQSHSSRFQQDDVNTECIGWVKERNDNGFIEKAQQTKCGKQQFSGTDSPQSGWRNFPTQSPICTGDDGLSGKLDGITFSKWRNESIKAAGNAIVPQVALQIFKAIQEYTIN
jgi:DNA (cytosine-5)-methyltransferase 1